MECPKCGVVLDTDFAECPRCGIVVAKFLRAHPEPHDSPAANIPALEPTPSASQERTIRAVALPAALIVARALVHASPGSVRMLTMWVHESGHAVSAWLCGFPAFPGPWFTPVAAERSPVFIVAMVAALAYGTYRARQLDRGFWVVASGGSLPAVLFCSLFLHSVKAHQFIIFGGDGGGFVLGTLLMLTIYARADHPIRENHVCWALLVIGALAFMDVYVVWSGPIDRLPFGDNENGLSDPSVLTEMYGWNVLTLIHRYLALARVCLAVLAVAYAAMLLRTRRVQPNQTPALLT